MAVFSHIWHTLIRLEGQTAWGVWLRINHWDFSQGRRARLHVGVPVSRGKPHSDFPLFSLHCEATRAPSFPGLDFCHLGFSPIFVSGGRVTTSSGTPPCLRHLLRKSLPELAHHLLCAKGTPRLVPPLHSHCHNPSPCTPPVPRLSGAYLACPSAHLSTRGSANRGSSYGSCSCPSTPCAPFTSPRRLSFDPSRGSPPGEQHWPSDFNFSPCCSASTSLS